MYQSLNDVQKNKIFNSFFAVIILLAVFLGVESLKSLKEYSYVGRGVVSSNVINVTGKGEVVTIPDIGEFSFAVVEEGKTVGEAQDKSAKKINIIVDAIKKMGVEEKDIKTTSYNSYPKYEYSSLSACSMGYCPPSKQILTGYEVNQTISIKIRKTSDAGNILTKVGDLGASNISGLNFVVDDTDKVQAEARDKAVADAKAKAKILSKSLGVKLKRVVNYYESGNQPSPYYGISAMKSEGMGGDMATVPSVPTGENKIISNVTITFEVE
ncbi:MAG: SIMPL domain-containing protein [Nitrospira sp.]